MLSFGATWSLRINNFLLQMLLQFEKELAQAVEALTKEQEKAAQAEKEKQTQV